MGWDWQEVLVLAAVLGALAYLVRRAWRSLAVKSGGHCAAGGCGSCPARGSEPAPLVGIGRIDRGPASPTYGRRAD